MVKNGQIFDFQEDTKRKNTRVLRTDDSFLISIASILR